MYWISTSWLCMQKSHTLCMICHIYLYQNRPNNPANFTILIPLLGKPVSVFAHSLQLGKAKNLGDYYCRSSGRPFYSLRSALGQERSPSQLWQSLCTCTCVFTCTCAIWQCAKIRIKHIITFRIKEKVNVLDILLDLLLDLDPAP